LDEGRSLAGNFLGFTSTNPFTSIVLFETGTGQQIFQMEDMQYVAAIPEPATYATLLAGLGILGLAARRRARKEVAVA
jgi:hypothetical protein